MKGNNNLRKNSSLDIHKEKSFQTFSKILDSKIPGGGSYQTSPENFNQNYRGTFPNFPGKFYSHRLRGGK